MGFIWRRALQETTEPFMFTPTQTPLTWPNQSGQALSGARQRANQLSLLHSSHGPGGQHELALPARQKHQSFRENACNIFFLFSQYTVAVINRPFQSPSRITTLVPVPVPIAITWVSHARKRPPACSAVHRSPSSMAFILNRGFLPSNHLPIISEPRRIIKTRVVRDLPKTDSAAHRCPTL